MAVRGFPSRKEDPLIQQLLERARQEYAQSSAIGSPSMYKAAAGGGIGPVASVLAAQILGGVRSGTAQRQAQEIANRQKKALSTTAELQTRGYTDTSQGRVFVDNDGRLMRVGDIPGQENNIGDLTSDVLKNAKYKINENQMEEVNKFIEESQGPLNEIARIANQEQSPEIIGQEDDISIIEPETTQSSIDPNIPKIPPIGLEPTTVTEGKKPSMLSRVLTGAGDTTKTYRTLGDYITDAGYDPLEYDLFQDQLKRKTNALEFKKSQTFFDKNNEAVSINMFIDRNTGLPVYKFAGSNQNADISQLSPKQKIFDTKKINTPTGEFVIVTEKGKRPNIKDVLFESKDKYEITADIPGLNKGQYAVIKNGQIQKIYGTADYKKVLDLSKEYRAVTKDINDGLRSLVAFKAAVSQPKNAIADTAVIFAYNKLLDPASVVRESEVQLVVEAQSTLENIKKSIGKITTGQKLSVIQVEQMKKVAKIIEENYVKGLIKKQKQYKDLAKVAGVEEDLVFTAYDSLGIR
tara:strand:- start:2379 stop:3941 length:1563 start_codon:yes stop_codon:yes gene_type:complete